MGGVRLSVGSSAIDYELDPANPTFHRMVMFGGRGWTIYELPKNPEALLKLVFDSGDDMETTVCEQIPWAYNAEADEEQQAADAASEVSRWNGHVANHKWSIALCILKRVSGLVGGDSNRSHGESTENARAQPQDFRAWVVVVGQFPRDLFNP